MHLLLLMVAPVIFLQLQLQFDSIIQEVLTDTLTAHVLHFPSGQQRNHKNEASEMCKLVGCLLSRLHLKPLMVVLAST